MPESKPNDTKSSLDTKKELIAKNSSQDIRQKNIKNYITNPQFSTTNYTVQDIVIGDNDQVGELASMERQLEKKVVGVMKKMDRDIKQLNIKPELELDSLDNFSRVKPENNDKLDHVEGEEEKIQSIKKENMEISTVGERSDIVMKKEKNVKDQFRPPRYINDMQYGNNKNIQYPNNKKYKKNIRNYDKYRKNYNTKNQYTPYNRDTSFVFRRNNNQNNNKLDRLRQQNDNLLREKNISGEK